MPQPDKRLETLELLGSVMGPTEAKHGCVACRLYEEAESDQTILFYEEWENKEVLSEHVRSENYRRILAAIELSSQPPEVHFYSVSTIQGIDLIEQLRGKDFDTSHLRKAVQSPPPARPETRFTS
jgi:quinol monooxygenase YgiN